MFFPYILPILLVLGGKASGVGAILLGLCKFESHHPYVWVVIQLVLERCLYTVLGFFAQSLGSSQDLIIIALIGVQGCYLYQRLCTMCVRSHSGRCSGL